MPRDTTTLYRAVGTGEMGPMTQQLRERLTAIQSGAKTDSWGWRNEI